MTTTQDFKCDDGEIVRVEYDECEREVLKTTLSASGKVKEWIEYRYSRSTHVVEWKWYDGSGKMIRSFIGEMHDGDITDIKQSEDVAWTVPLEHSSGKSEKT